MEIVSSAQLSISYDGELLRTGLMDVQELAPALLASGTLIQKANALLNGQTTSISLKVRSDFRRGSFLVNFVIDQSLLDQAKNLLLAHPSIKDTKDVLDILFFYAGLPIGTASGLFKLIKFLGHKKPDSVTLNDKNKSVTLVLEDNNITVNQVTYNLYQDPEVRRAASKVVEPLSRNGIDKLEIRGENDDELETVDKQEAEAFSYFPEDEGEMLIDRVADSWLSIIALSFNPDHKWRFSTGGSTLTANITDPDFWGRVHKHEEIFEEGDQLLVALRTFTYRDPTGKLQTRYTVEKVNQHRHAPKQAKLL
jgi:hypothetical protein